MKRHVMLVCLLVAALTAAPCAAIGETARQSGGDALREASRQVLQKGLTLYEIDQELSRIAELEQQLNAQISATEQELERARASSDEARRHAGKVIRAYYMGDRDTIWLLLFSIRSLSDALSTLEYLQMILSSDRRALRQHSEEQARLSRITEELAQSRLALQESKERYLSGRERLVALQKELDEALAASGQADQLRQQMEALNAQWQEEGVPLFKTYFRELAKAMKDLPEMVTAGSGGNSRLILNGFNYTFQLTDEELNEFLRQKNELFHRLTFRFTADQVIAEGMHENTTVLIKGNYRLETKNASDGKAVQYAKYSIDELQYNGYMLPDTTIRALESEFDLGIYPQNIASFLQVTGIDLEEGTMSVMLKLAL
ncbi:hypothetical protein [Paenibacillus ginsengihumi]|uniref:hypothetical protein n=1 Tax=Paenibacillus ginsengihumi TaxID=431596 RepID=UPI0003756A4D|nr:hypothetical protein [Paenibacillus ginsengihumi]